jgi:hypothetical protein
MSTEQLVSDTLLASSGAYGITRTSGVYSSVSFALSLANGIFGIVENSKFR